MAHVMLSVYILHFKSQRICDKKIFKDKNIKGHTGHLANGVVPMGFRS